MSEGTWNKTFPSLIEHTRAKAVDVNTRVNGLASNYDFLPNPHDDGKLGFFGACYVGVPAELGQAVTALDIRNSTLITGADSGAANAYVITNTVASLAYTVGMKVAFVAGNTNTGTSTINVDSLGVVPLKASATIDLPADYVYVGDYVEAVYMSGAYFQVTSVTSHVADAANSAAQAANSAAQAANSAAAAASSESVAMAASNYIGNWSDQTGAHNVPTSVSHSGEYWMLVNNVGDITLSEPGVSADWIVIETGVVDSIIGTTGEIDIDNTDPRNPVVSISPDFPRTLEPPIGVLFTGNYNGLDVRSNSVSPDDSIDVEAGNIYDTTGTIKLTLASNTTAVLTNDYPSPAINEVYSLFLTDAGELHFDTDPNGATLTGAGADVGWITWGVTDASGNFIPMSHVGDKYSYDAAVNIGTASGGTKTAFSIADFCVSERVKSCTVRLQLNATGWYHIYVSGDAGSTTLVSYYRSSNDAAFSGEVIPYNGNVYAAGAGGAVSLVNFTVKK